MCWLRFSNPLRIFLRLASSSQLQRQSRISNRNKLRSLPHRKKKGMAEEEKEGNWERGGEVRKGKLERGKDSRRRRMRRGRKMKKGRRREWEGTRKALLFLLATSFLIASSSQGTLWLWQPMRSRLVALLKLQHSLLSFSHRSKQPPYNMMLITSSLRHNDSFNIGWVDLLEGSYCANARNQTRRAVLLLVHRTNVRKSVMMSSWWILTSSLSCVATMWRLQRMRFFTSLALAIRPPARPSASGYWLK